VVVREEEEREGTTMEASCEGNIQAILAQFRGNAVTLFHMDALFTTPYAKR